MSGRPCTLLCTMKESRMNFLQAPENHPEIIKARVFAAFALPGKELWPCEHSLMSLGNISPNTFIIAQKPPFIGTCQVMSNTEIL